MAQKITQYVVTGPGPFPDDMLRYDQAKIVDAKPWPWSTARQRSMFLIQGYCTEARWQSFLWTVLPVRKRLPAGNSEQGPVITEYCFGDKWERWP